MQAGTIALSMNCGAYMAEIIRAGIESVDKGQMEASRSLGLSYGKSMRLVVIPQAIRTMIPSIINQFIITLKDTSILSVIGFPELTNMGKTISGNTFKSLQTWAIGRYYVYGDHYYAQQDRKEDREEDQTWQIRKQWFTLRT